jgi:hypothetical protein
VKRLRASPAATGRMGVARPPHWHPSEASGSRFIAQAQLEELTLVAHDEEIGKYEVAVLEAGE